MNTFSEIGKIENIQAYLEKVKSKEKKLTGFGHRVYKTFDPRAILIKEQCKKLYEDLGISPPPLFELAEALEKSAL